MDIRMIPKLVIVFVGLLLVALGAAIAFGGPASPKPMASINDPFKAIDFSDLPPLLQYKAQDGTALAYRQCANAGGTARGSVVLVHGSSGSSNSMHALAKALANAGYAACALDIRGHGVSGPKGTITYVGQLEDDMESFVNTVSLAKPATLAGFSAGGGFVLRFAGSQRQDAFQNYLLLSPFLSPQAPNYRPGSGGWVSVGIPRVVGLALLNRIGVRVFNGLPVTSFALSEEAKSFLTPTYSFSLAVNFAPLQDYKANIRAVHQPVNVVAGSSDEVFVSDKLEGIVREQGQSWSVTLVPGIGHIPLTLDPAAISVIVKTVEAMPKNGA
jgi:alpha-beta hydrolase superfamily lysophospholipase